MLPSFALFSLKPLAHLHPKPSLPHSPPNRRQYTVCHLCRRKSQHSHQWYVSQSVPPAPPLSSANEWTPFHIVHFSTPTSAVSLSVLARCMTMTAYLSYSSPFVLFYVPLIWFPGLRSKATASSSLSVFLFFSQANNRTEQWKTIRTKVIPETAYRRPAARRRLQCF